MLNSQAKAKTEAEDAVSHLSLAMSRANGTEHSHPLTRKNLCKDLGLEDDFGGCVKMVETVGCVRSPAGDVASESQDDAEVLSTTWCALWQESTDNEAGAFHWKGLGKQQRLNAHAAKGGSEAAAQEEEDDVQDEEREEEEEAEEEEEEEGEEPEKENKEKGDENDGGETKKEAEGSKKGADDESGDAEEEEQEEEQKEEKSMEDEKAEGREKKGDDAKPAKSKPPEWKVLEVPVRDPEKTKTLREEFLRGNRWSNKKDEDKPMPEQGFGGKPVAHDNMQTYTGDWAREYRLRHEKDDLDREYARACAKYYKSRWCTKHGYKLKKWVPPVKALAAPQTGFSLASVFLALVVALSVSA